MGLARRETDARYMTSSVENPALETPTEPKTEPRWRHFFRHALEMVVAMLVGMELPAPIWAGILGQAFLARPEVAAFVAATDMTVAMTVWMLYRGHGRARVLEMAAAMYVPYLLVLVPYWLGLFPGEDVLMAGHALMLPAMAVAMLIHREEYSRPHGNAHGDHHVHPLIGVLGHRAPTWIALARVRGRMEPMSEVVDGRLRRGARSRQTILRHAVDVASLEGLTGLSLGRLATATSG
jgi:hypothetical protein